MPADWTPQATAPEAGAEHPLRQARRRRGLTTTALADLAGLSQSFISMVETGQRPLRRRDDINALAAALRVPPAEIAPSISPAFDEWAPPLPAPASAFPPLSDDITVARHRELAAQFIKRVSRGDRYAAGVWLRRIARDPAVSPWLLLDQLTAPQTGLAGHAQVRTGNAMNSVSASTPTASSTNHGRSTNRMSNQHAAKVARAGLSRAVAMSEELLDAHASNAGHKTSAEWLTALISRSQQVNNAARDYLTTTEPAQATA
jgi:transcriptional regulator with XRE-family HTH domain